MLSDYSDYYLMLSIRYSVTLYLFLNRVGGPGRQHLVGLHAADPVQAVHHAAVAHVEVVPYQVTKGENRSETMKSLAKRT